MLHLNRKEITNACPICGEPAFKPCKISDAVTIQQEFELAGDETEIGYLEYQILATVLRLRKIKANHIFVIAVESVLKYQAKVQPTP